MTKPRIAASSYLNTAPLCYSFLQGRQKDSCRFLSDAAPARCADLLRAAEADAALIPVIEYQRIPGLRVVPGISVSSMDSVRSVILASRTPIESVRTVALDTSSRTSAVLVQIILTQFYRLAPAYTSSPPNVRAMLEKNDAALIIGDPAILVDRSRLVVYDLAEEWRKHTGLPFVFAFWAVRADSLGWYNRPDAAVDFAEAKREGIVQIPDIAREYSASLGLEQADLVRYLTENISFDLGGESLRALNLYYRLAFDCRLIDKVVDVSFMPKQ